MSQRSKNTGGGFDPITCEKYLSRLMRQNQIPASYNKKLTVSNAGNQKTVSTNKQQQATSLSQPAQQQKSNKTGRQQSPVMRQNNSAPPIQTIVSHLHDSIPIKDTIRSHRARQRSASRTDQDREPWGQLLASQRSKDKVSSFSNFDPLRTLHFLWKELKFRLQNCLPDDNEILQMVSDIHHALKRIPPEVASVIHFQQTPEIQGKLSGRSITEGDKSERLLDVIRPQMLDKPCQTPPSFSHEDTEKLQKIMEESTLKLEISCKQLEMLCANLHSENESLTKQLEEERNTVGALNEQVAELQTELDEVCTQKVQVLEEENHHLKMQIERLTGNDTPNAATLNQLKEVVTQLEKRKADSDQRCAKLQYELVLANMEKEKYVTVLAVREKEIKEIHEEMGRVQDEVGKQLAKLNGEMMSSRASSAHSLTAIPSSTWNPDDNKENHHHNPQTVGDSTISSIATDNNDTAVKLSSTLVEPEAPPRFSSGDGTPSSAPPCLALQESGDSFQEHQGMLMEAEKLMKDS